MMWPERGLFIWPVADHKVHHCPGLGGHEKGGWRDDPQVEGPF